MTTAATIETTRSSVAVARARAVFQGYRGVQIPSAPRR